MARFIFWTIIFTITGGFFLHSKKPLPFLDLWFGKLPGDMIITKGKMLVYLPLVSAAIIAFIFSVILSFIFKSRK